MRISIARVAAAFLRKSIIVPGTESRSGFATGCCARHIYGCLIGNMRAYYKRGNMGMGVRRMICVKDVTQLPAKLQEAMIQKLCDEGWLLVGGSYPFLYFERVTHEEEAHDSSSEEARSGNFLL